VTISWSHRGEDIRIKTTGASSESGRSFLVTWCNRWDLIDELVDNGIGNLRRDHCGPDTYGHCDYFYV